MKIYYAHSKLIYNTPAETIAIEIILNNFVGKVIDPNHDMGELGSIIPYLKMVEQCDVIVIHPHKHYIGKGVYEELKHALSHNKEIFVLLYHVLLGYHFRPVKGQVIHDSTDWKFKYGKVLY